MRINEEALAGLTGAGEIDLSPIPGRSMTENVDRLSCQPTDGLDTLPDNDSRGSPIPFILSAMQSGANVTCPYCGEPLWVEVDAGGGAQQQFISDCEVCCKPIEFRTSRGGLGEVSIETRGEF